MPIHLPGISRLSEHDADYNRRRLLHQLTDYFKDKPCQCGNKNLKLVPLYEYGDPILPSRVVRYCASCRRNEAVAVATLEDAIAYAEEQMGEKLIRDPKVIDTLIDPTAPSKSKR